MTLPPVTVRRILVGTDRSHSADVAVRWAADLAISQGAELYIVRVLIPQVGDGTMPSVSDDETARATSDLERYAEEVAGSSGRAIVVVDEDAAQGILRAADDAQADTVVVGNVGMAGRREFLLGNVPNRISHKARCNVIIVNTSNGASPPRMLPAVPEGREGRLMRRAWRLGRILVRAGLREVMGRPELSDDDETRDRARRFRDALDEAGPTFAKLGQVLSTRPDLLPPSFLEELSTLQERVTPLSEAEVVKAMERELGVPWEDVFATIDSQPLAAGTIAQVHRATLENGDRVVVKVQRPNAEQDILDDLGLLEMFAQKAAGRPGLRRAFDLPAIIQHLSQSLRRELDFRMEASNLGRMAEILAPYSRLAVPAVYEGYSTARLLVMEEVQGIPLAQAPEGTERTEAARQLLESFYAQVMVAGFFHADPHPGNMKWWDGTIYLLDLGMVGEVEPSVRELILLLLLAFAQEDSAFLSEIVIMLASGDEGPDGVNLAGFKEEVAKLVARYRNVNLRDLQLGPLLTEVTEVALRQNVPVPTSLMLTGKAFSQMQLAVAALDPELDPFAVAGSFVVKNTIGRTLSSLSPRRLFYESQKLGVRVNRILEAVEGLVGARPGGRLTVNFRGTERLEDTVARSTRQLSLALGASSALLGTALTANSTRMPRWVTIAMGGVGSAMAAGLMLELRRKPSK